MAMVILLFLAYTAFCYWAIVLDGVEALETWKTFFLFGWFAASLTPTELKFYLGISWLASMVLTLIQLFSGTAG